MTISGIIPALSRASAFDRVLRAAARDADFSVVDGLRVPLLAALLAERNGPQCAFVITATGREAEAVRDAVHCYAPDADVLEFPAWETLPHERLSPSAQTVGTRIATLRRMADFQAAMDAVAAGGPGAEPPRSIIVVASVRAALQPIADNLTALAPLVLRTNSRGNDLTDLAGQLVDLAYARVDLVSRRGEFAVRGGILDVFPPTADHPVRVDFFGDEIDGIKAFSVADQRSTDDDIGEVTLTASRELLLSEGVRQRAREMLHEFPNLGQMLAKVAEGIPVEGMESLAPALVENLVPVTHYLPTSASVAVFSPERVIARAKSLADTNQEFLQAAWSAAVAGAQAPIDLDAGNFLSLGALKATRGDRIWWSVSPFDSGADLEPAAGAGESGADDAEQQAHRAQDAIERAVESAGDYIRVPAVSVPSFAGSADGAVDHVVDLAKDGWAVVVTAQGTGLVDRAVQVLVDAGADARAEAVTEPPQPGVVLVTTASVEHGFALSDPRILVLSEAEFYGRTAQQGARQVKKLASRRKNVVDPMQLKAGDVVVHTTHGIGKFLELTSREVSSGGRNAVKTSREYLVLEYAPSKRGYPGDKLYVPTDQLDQLSRYVGGEAPSLSKMGGSDWAAAKGKARKAVRDIAVELVKLYSARMASKGHAFGPDTPWQRELEEAFPFAETPDQLTTIDEIKADMERPIPMDRLLSGDVGYGKTEVAIRAAFKAVQDGKQVAMLVPTTLLVRQHMETFQERFAGFPVHLRALSRFQTEKESKETMKGLLDGTVDIVIGTHRILSQGVQFKDVGLVIIDEEQRFGVEHKDQLKKLKTNVDVLAMSATPIPRSLEMAVTGIREMSTLATPPEDRHPILTFVGPQSDMQVAAAIRRELLREGQVFYVHNRVKDIQGVAAHLAELIPEARIAVAHGQMAETTLEQVMVDFWERRFDVLVSTTIIETGLDIANANTLIIDRADKYGLSQLHQLRGRVGRGRERGYAYFLYDADKPLSETAQDRLETIAANNELGAGMQVALKDLEIRGAGNLLGGEQSGHIAGVGFDLYLRMIGEAVGQFRGDVAEGQTELRLELPVDARIPEEYVESERLRLEAYQKLSAASSPSSQENAIAMVLDELTDRYGAPPQPVSTLIEVSKLRRMAQQVGLSDVVVMGSNLRVSGKELADSMQVRLTRMFQGARWFAQQNATSIPMPRPHGEPLPDAELILWVEGILTAIYGATVPEAATA
ncbi:transcription-repair coupling factor [Curtobacterium sp. Leaf261]|uniref:transcription-repair coupling factor n=1 Tax=Curtobacterium sp. Leaf261 TaxID=1736311 RepID=UPI0006F3BB20|nr:transcription-repair coupling factor [Curtobacterium sp. Leaf261]KQO62811.1 transcription-repair coupling factor [Curtobacterium sp. Leaf261]